MSKSQKKPVSTYKKFKKIINQAINLFIFPFLWIRKQFQKLWRWLRPIKPKSTNLTHYNLMCIVRVFAPKIFMGGVCKGFTSMWIQALLMGKKEEAHFYKRLNILSKFVANPKNKIDTLKKEIDAIYESQKNPLTRRKLTEDEYEKTEIRAFCEGVALQQSASHVKVFKNPESINVGSKALSQAFTKMSKVIHQMDFDTLNPFTAPKKLEDVKQKITTTTVGVLALTKEELTEYFKALEILLIQKKEQKIAFLLGSDNHATGIYFDTFSKEWHFMDVNNASRAHFNDYCIPANTHSEKLANSIFTSLSVPRVSKSKESPYTVLTVTSFSTQTDPALLQSIQAVGHKLLSTTAMRTNSRGCNTLFLAIVDNETNIVEALIKAGADVNHKFRGISPLIIAAMLYKPEIVKALVKAGATIEIPSSFKLQVLGSMKKKIALWIVIPAIACAASVILGGPVWLSILLGITLITIVATITIRGLLINFFFNREYKKLIENYMEKPSEKNKPAPEPKLSTPSPQKNPTTRVFPIKAPVKSTLENGASEGQTQRRTASPR